MNLFKYALKNLKVHKARNIIMGITLVLVITASVVGLSIQRAAQNVSDEYRKGIGAEANIEVDYNKVTKSGQAPKPITAEQYEKISQLEYVKKFSYLTEVMLGSDQLKAVGEDNQKGEDQMGIVAQGDDGKPVQLKTPKLKLIGGGGNAALPEFQKGSRSIKEGTAPQNDNEAMISEELAKLNNLKVGDSFRLKDAEGKVEKEFKLTGIYEDKTIADGGTGVDMPLFNRRNEVITKFASAMSMSGQGMAEVRATYELNNTKDFEAFKEKVRALGISDDYTISMDEAGFNKAVGPINNVNSTVTYFIVIIIIIAAGVLILLSVLALRERQYEIGVLRAMGMKKRTVGLNFIIESGIVLCIALIIGFIFAGLITKPVANTLLNDQISAMEQAKEKESQNSQKNIFAPDRTGDIKSIDKMDVTIDYSVLLQIVGFGFIIILFTNTLNIIYIMRFQPMEIMRRKN